MTIVEDPIGIISALGATPIDYTKSSFVERIRELTGDGVDVVLDGIGGSVALGSYRALRRGGRLVMDGHYGTTVGPAPSVSRDPSASNEFSRPAARPTYS